MDLFKNLQELQSKIGDNQEKLQALRAEGSAGGDLIKVIINGHMQVVSVKIDPIAVDPQDITMLEELMAASFTDAVVKMKTLVQQEMGQILGAAGFPSGMMG